MPRSTGEACAAFLVPTLLQFGTCDNRKYINGLIEKNRTSTTLQILYLTRASEGWMRLPQITSNRLFFGRRAPTDTRPAFRRPRDSCAGRARPVAFCMHYSALAEARTHASERASAARNKTASPRAPRRHDATVFNFVRCSWDDKSAAMRDSTSASPLYFAELVS